MVLLIGKVGGVGSIKMWKKLVICCTSVTVVASSHQLTTETTIFKLTRIITITNKNHHLNITPIQISRNIYTKTYHIKVCLCHPTTKNSNIRNIITRAVISQEICQRVEGRWCRLANMGWSWSIKVGSGSIEFSLPTMAIIMCRETTEDMNTLSKTTAHCMER